MINKDREPRKEFIRKEMAKIDPGLHREVINRRIQRESIDHYNLEKGLKSIKGSGSKELLEIADLEDECIIRIQELNVENQTRVNQLMPENKAWNQHLVVERIHSTLARSEVGPALLWQIQKKNK